MNIEVNGKQAFPEGLTLSGLITELSLDTAKIAIERNLEIVPRSEFGIQVLAEGCIEIVHFIGGGDHEVSGLETQTDMFEVAGGKFASTPHRWNGAGTGTRRSWPLRHQVPRWWWL